MDKSIIERISPEERRKIAVAYLVRNTEEQPENTKKLFIKLGACEGAAERTNIALSKANEAVSQLQNKFYQILGSIDTLSDLVVEELISVDEDTIIKWCESFRPRSMSDAPPTDQGVDMPGKPNIPAGDVDMAGATSHQR